MTFPILQFGTSRFLQAHVDLFIDQGFVEGSGKGRIAVVQTTSSPESARRVAFFDSGAPYIVRVRGLDGEMLIDKEVSVASIGRGIDANADWAEVERLFVAEARWIVSNTGDRGFELSPGDTLDGIPRAFPAKLAKLLFARFTADKPPLTLFPCELIEDNGDKLRALVGQVAREWKLGADFERWIENDCLWINSLVDRIVSEPLEPAGAVAEPYALWAVENRPGLVMPCKHPAVVVTDDLKRYERLKLFILNLGHTYLAEGWAKAGAAPKTLTREWLADAAVRADLRQARSRPRGARISRQRADALPQSVPRSLSRGHLPQSRFEEGAPLRRPDRARPTIWRDRRATTTRGGAGERNGLSSDMCQRGTDSVLLK